VNAMKTTKPKIRIGTLFWAAVGTCAVIGALGPAAVPNWPGHGDCKLDPVGDTGYRCAEEGATCRSTNIFGKPYTGTCNTVWGNVNRPDCLCKEPKSQ